MENKDRYYYNVMCTRYENGNVNFITVQYTTQKDARDFYLKDVLDAKKTGSLLTSLISYYTDCKENAILEIKRLKGNLLKPAYTTKK